MLVVSNPIQKLLGSYFLASGRKRVAGVHQTLELPQNTLIQTRHLYWRDPR